MRGEVWPQAMPSHGLLQDDEGTLDPAGKERRVEHDHCGRKLVPAGDEPGDNALVSVRIVLQPRRIGVVAAEHADSLPRSERSADVHRLRVTDRVQPVLSDADPRLFLAASCSSDVVAGLTKHVDPELSNARATPSGLRRAAPPSDSLDPPTIGHTWQSLDRGQICRPVHSKSWSLLL